MQVILYHHICFLLMSLSLIIQRMFLQYFVKIMLTDPFGQEGLEHFVVYNGDFNIYTFNVYFVQICFFNLK